MSDPILTQYMEGSEGEPVRMPHRAMGMDPNPVPQAMGMAPRQEENNMGMETILPNAPMPEVSQGIPKGMVEVPQQLPQGPNPFEGQQYQNINVPDAPLSYGGGMVETLLNDNEVPEKIRKDFWFVFHKDNTLGFLDEKRKQNKLLAFDIAKIDALACLPYYDYDFEMEMKWGVLRNVFDTKLDRALGHKGGNIKNERIMLQSQFSEQRQISENDQGGNIKEGFFKRLLGRR
jgi:hypothetical protein